MILETTRLYLREHTADDALNAYNLNLDPEVVKYTGDVSFTSVEEAQNFLLNYDHYRKYGFGRWAVILKQTNDYLGWCGLKYTPDLDEFDIGFRLMKMHWNQGYATEAAKACLEIGFNKFNMKAIVGRAMKKNLASIKVLQKLGLTFIEERIKHNEIELIYKIEKPK
jgi:RimJ/RimL family protein N-acetyltransferase